MAGLLGGVRVVSLAWRYPGPYCTLLLADMGADVVLVERPGIGDPARHQPYFFEALNRNKRSLTLDLERAEGREVCHRLAAEYDVFLEGFRPGVARRLGMDYESLKRVNPRLIYVSISGYGQHGPYAGRPAHDITYQGVAGMLAAALSRGEPLQLPPVPIADLSSGMFATIGVLGALLYRSASGQGQHVDVSMVDGLVSWLTAPLVRHLHLGELLPPREAAYGVFKTKEGNYLTLSMTQEDHFWANICRAIGREELAGLSRSERLARREELAAMLREAFLARSRDEWVEILCSHDAPAGPVNSYAEAVSDPHLCHRGLFAEIETEGGVLKQVAHPLKFSAAGAEFRLPPPRLGEHSEEILLGLGYSGEQVSRLRQQGVV